MFEPPVCFLTYEQRVGGAVGIVGFVRRYGASRERKTVHRRYTAKEASISMDFFAKHKASAERKATQQSRDGILE